MSMSQKRKVKELEARIEALENTLDQVMRYLESQSQSQSDAPSGKD
jgi:hypothetical protein